MLCGILGGIIQLEDLRRYTVKVKDPLVVKLENGNYTVYGPPPPASGAIYEFILNIVDGKFNTCVILISSSKSDRS